MEIRKVMGQRAKQRREQLNLKLKEVALDCGVSLSTIARLEAGESWPEVELFVKLHEVLKLPLGSLVAQKIIHIEPTPLQASELVTEYVRRVQTIPDRIIEALIKGDPFLWEKIEKVALGHDAVQPRADKKLARRKDTA